ncbi:MAG: hypothetical protein M1834_002830 [Cirrosporium novae-zelandiae]|nr:MAG: hypothetical protein M1834_002830 [Cirrosporium novae-zelandiae]
MPKNNGLKKLSANQHNSRHENGLVGPGKKVSKQKSNGHLNGSANGSARAQSRTPPLPSPVQSTSPVLDASDNPSDGVMAESRLQSGGAHGYTQDDGSRRRSSRGSDSSGYSPEIYQNSSVPVNNEQPRRRIDVNAAKNPAVHDSTSPYSATTLIRSCPLIDTIAILIIFLQVPPALVTFFQFMFAALTFPSGGTIFSLSAIDIFQGTNGGPSVATILVADTALLLVWLMLSNPVQSFALDLASARIAMTLGGGPSRKAGLFDSILLCIMIVSIAQLSRSKYAQRYLMEHLLPAGVEGDSYSLENPQTSSFSFFSATSTSTPAGGIKSMLTVHILAQGLILGIRRWLIGREKTKTSRPGRSTDPEASAGSHTPDTQVPADSTSISSLSVASDVPPPTPTITKDTRDKTSSVRRKRRQGTLVKSQQPLWAAIAQCKVNYQRDGDGAIPARGAPGSRPEDTEILPPATFDREAGKVWVTDVEATKIHFSTSPFSLYYSSSTDDDDSDRDTASRRPCADQPKPFYIRVNGADWTSVICNKLPELDIGGGRYGEQWYGEIFGLAPKCTYLCTFLRSSDDQELFSVSITTPAALNAEQVPNATSHRAGLPLRPSSPTTTLKNSIAAQETKLQEVRSKQKRIRKDHKSSVAAQKREVDALSQRLNSSGTTDERQRQRILQVKQSIKQADEATAEMKNRIEELANVPETETSAWKQGKMDWDEENSKQAATEIELTKAKANAERQLNQTSSDISTTSRARERLQARAAKLTEQHQKARTTIAPAINEKTQRIADQIAKDHQRQQVESDYQNQFKRLEQDTLESKSTTQALWQQIQHLHSSLEEAASPVYNLNDLNDPPLQTPEGDLPGTMPQNSQNSISQAFSYFPSFTKLTPIPIENHDMVVNESASPPHTVITVVDHAYGRPRGRSSSMLSGASGTTDFFDADASMTEGRPPFGTVLGNVGGDGSQRDPMSPPR